MDGPWVNWKVFDMLSSNVEEFNVSKKILNIGSCGLRVMHNAFRKGCTSSGWEIEEKLSSIYWLLKDCPARRHDFVNIKCRWLENVSVMEHALVILPHIKTFVDAVNRKQINDPKMKSFDTVKKGVATDRLFAVKGQVFISVASTLEPFMKKYQTDKPPMLPFMVSDLYLLLNDLCKRFIKLDVLSNLSSASALVKLNISDESNHRNASEIRIGFSASELLTTVKRQYKLSDNDVFTFRLECKKFFMGVVSKLIE